MATVSLCMIVKNEEQDLKTCLESVKDLVDEMVIVDTGSTDRTEEIARSYGAKVEHFRWVDDFAAARNYAFSLCSCDYIYSADADERLDVENQTRFRLLKDNIDPRIEIVQMVYVDHSEHRSVYNFERELRPKLFKRVRSFVWEDPIHEQVRLSPVVFDSEIEIIHTPRNQHAGRDLATFRKAIDRGVTMTDRLFSMYARELYMAGTEEDLAAGFTYFAGEADSGARGVDELRMACCIAARAARLHDDLAGFMKYAMKCVAADGCSEICCELGAYYLDAGDYNEAQLWYYNAAFETQPLMDIHAGGDKALLGLASVYELSGDEGKAQEYRTAAEQWTAPVEI